MPENSAISRPLLPYEHGLIEALGISKQEYLDFVCTKHEYIDAKDGTIFDARNALATIAIVLTVVGTIFQVAAALMAPKPEQAKGQETTTREERAVPRFGFNGVQSISKYGDPVGLIYTNASQNKNGGVRASTLLLWSAVMSYGGSQFMQLMLSIGASKISSIIPERTAIGQLPFNEIIRSNAWLYFSGNGPTAYKDYQPIDDVSGSEYYKQDPTWYDNSANVTTAALPYLKQNKRGFSQSYAPTTGNTCSVTGVVPIGAKIIELQGSGDLDATIEVPVTIQGVENYWNNGNSRPRFPKGEKITIVIKKTTSDYLRGLQGKKAIQSALRNCAAVFDEGSMYKLGGAIFRAQKIVYEGRAEIEFSSLKVTLVCEKSGSLPTIDISDTWNGKDEGQDRNSTQVKISTNDSKVVRLNDQLAAANERLDWLTRNTWYDSVAIKNQKDEIKDIESKISSLQKETSSLDSQRNSSPTVYSSTLERIGTKCLARIEQAAYSSVTKCESLELSLKLQLFRQVSGRQKKYGSDERDYGYKAGENGQQPRVAMFTCEYKLDDDSGFATVPYIFCVRGSVQQDSFAYLRLIRAGGGPSSWRVRMNPVVDPVAEARSSNVVFNGYAYINSNGSKQSIDNGKAKLEFNGFIENSFTAWPPINNGPDESMEWELFNYDVRTQTRYSYEQGPEIVITAVNEQLKDEWSQYSNSLYEGLSTLSVHAFAGRGFQDLRDVTVWVDNGKLVRKLSNRHEDYNSSEKIATFVASSKLASSSYAPEIFVDTVLDKENGIGQYARIESVHMQELAKAQAFCEENGFFMDGAIVDPQSWRQFWAQTAAYSLLELASIGGQTTLVPSIPADSAGRILSDRPLNITALFNQGNILEGSYKEEFIDYGTSTQDVIVTVIYRDSEDKGYFPRNESLTLRLKSANEALCIRETIDVSQFVTTRRQAVYIGRLMCLMRNLSRKAYELKTLPTDTFIMPGAYVFIDIGQETWDDLYTGSIMEGGTLNLPIGGSLPEAASGTAYDYFLYNGRESTFLKRNVLTKGGKAPELASYDGYLFAVGRKSSARGKRVARVTNVDMDEEGLVTLKAVEHPTDDNDVSLIAQRIKESSFFVES